MKRATITIALCLLTLTVGAENDYEEYGDWWYTEVAPTLMDEGYRFISMGVVSGGAIIIAVTDDALKVLIQFDEFIGGGGEWHKRDVMIVSDVMAVGKAPTAWLGTGSKTLIWQGAAAEAIVAYIRGASALMVRTTDYRGGRVDFAAELVPDDFAAAWARLGVDSEEADVVE